MQQQLPSKCMVLALMCVVFVCYILGMHVTAPVSRLVGQLVGWLVGWSVGWSVSSLRHVFPCLDCASVGQVCPSKLLMCHNLITLLYHTLIPIIQQDLFCAFLVVY